MTFSSFDIVCRLSSACFQWDCNGGKLSYCCHLVLELGLGEVTRGLGRRKLVLEVTLVLRGMMLLSVCGVYIRALFVVVVFSM